MPGNKQPTPICPSCGKDLDVLNITYSAVLRLEDSKWLEKHVMDFSIYCANCEEEVELFHLNPKISISTED